MLAKIQKRDGDFETALNSLANALEADPESVATHFDLGQLLKSLGQDNEAESHFAIVCRLSPESGYASQLQAQGFVLDESNETLPSVLPVGYEIKTFDGDESFMQQLDIVKSMRMKPLSRWRASVESGILYNSNISLTPISRQLVNADAASMQAFLNPEFEMNWRDGSSHRLGPLASGYFSFNEQQHSDYNLAAFQGGFFFEQNHYRFNNDLITRLDYCYSLDLQGGIRFADQHSINFSATSIASNGNITYLHGGLSFSDFVDDGMDPAYDSFDGLAFVTGCTRFIRWNKGKIRTIRFGGDLSGADTRGADYRFIGGNLYGGVTIGLTESIYLEPDIGLGYRNFYDFSGTVNRDELIMRFGLRLERQITDRLSIGAVVGYNRFASDNEFYDAERTEGGLITSWLY